MPEELLEVESREPVPELEPSSGEPEELLEVESADCPSPVVPDEESRAVLASGGSTPQETEQARIAMAIVEMLCGVMAVATSRRRRCRVLYRASPRR